MDGLVQHYNNYIANVLELLQSCIKPSIYYKSYQTICALLWWGTGLFCGHHPGLFITLRPRQNGRHFPDDIFKCLFFNENVWISINISLRCVPKGPVTNIPALVQIIAWRWLGDKRMSEPMVFSLLTHICVTQPQWDNYDCTRASEATQTNIGK